MNSNPEYIHELIRKLHSWNIYGQSHERCNAELAAANALQALLTERDEYKRRAEAADIRRWEDFSLISAVWYGKDAYFRQDDGMVYSRISGEYMNFDQAVDEFVCEMSEDN